MISGITSNAVSNIIVLKNGEEEELMELVKAYNKKSQSYPPNVKITLATTIPNLIL